MTQKIQPTEYVLTRADLKLPYAWAIKELQKGSSKQSSRVKVAVIKLSKKQKDEEKKRDDEMAQAIIFLTKKEAECSGVKSPKTQGKAVKEEENSVGEEDVFRI